MPTNLKRDSTLGTDKVFKNEEKENENEKESTTDKLLREITDLRLIYNEVLNELDVLKSVINDFDEIKKEVNLLKGSVESNSKSLLEIINPKEKPVLSLERPSGLKKKGTGLVVGQTQIGQTQRIKSGESIIIKRK